MGEIVNLNKFRKEREREAEKREARGNRVRFGLSGNEKALQQPALEKARSSLDGKKRDDAPGAGATPETPAPKAR